MANLPELKTTNSNAAQLVEVEWRHWLASKGSADEGTVKTYVSVWNQAYPVVRQIMREAGGFGIEQVRQYIDLLRNDPDGPKKQNTISTHVSIMSSFWRHLQAKGVIKENPWAQVKLKRNKDTFQERILTEEEMHDLINAASDNKRDQLIMRCLYLLGLRISELTTLRWRDVVERKAGTVVVTVYGKGGKTRYVKMPYGFYQELLSFHKGIVDKESALFTTKYGGITRPISDRQVRNIIEKYAMQLGWIKKVWNAEKKRIVKIGKRVSPHWFRHSHSTHALNRGAKLHVLQKSLGHADISTTGQYLHVLGDESSTDFIPDPWGSSEEEEGNPD